MKEQLSRPTRAMAGADAGAFCGCPLLRDLAGQPAPLQESAVGAPEPGRRVLVLVNPASGSSSAQRAQRAAELAAGLAAAARLGLEVERVDTTHAGHALELCAGRDLGRIDAVCVAGGDGTLREAVEGMLSRQDGATSPGR